MIHHIKSNHISLILLLGSIVLLLEVSFFNKGLIFSLLVAGGMIYIGRKKMLRSKIGKLLFWLGLLFFIVSIVNMMTFKFLCLVILSYYIIRFLQSKNTKNYIQPTVKIEDALFTTDTIIKKRPLFENILSGHQKSSEHVYEWNDINIQVGVGDTVIDLSNTVLPRGETVIFIRNIIGKVEVLIPYDIEIAVNHSVIFGSTNILGLHEEKTYNQVLQLETANFQQAVQKVKIFTSMMVGDLEVKRV